MILSKSEWSTIEYSSINGESTILFDKWSNNPYPGDSQFGKLGRTKQIIEKLCELTGENVKKVALLHAYRLAGSIEVHEDQSFAEGYNMKYAILISDSLSFKPNIYKKPYSGESNDGFGVCSFIHVPYKKRSIQNFDISTKPLQFIRFNPRKLHGIVNNGILNCFVLWVGK